MSPVNDRDKEWEKIKAVRTERGLGGPGGHHRRGEKPKNAWKTLWRLFTYLSHFRLFIVLAVLLIMVSSLAGIAGTWLLKPLINGLAAGSAPADLIVPLLQMAAIYVIAALATWLSSILMVQVGQGATFRIRNELFSHLQDLPLRYFDSKSHGELMSRFTNDVDTVNMALEQSLAQTITSVITVVGVFIMMLVLSPFLTLFVVAMMIVMLLSIKYIGRYTSRFFRDQQKSLGDLNGLIEEMIIGQKVVKVFSHEARVMADFTERNAALRQAATDAQTYAGVLMPVMGNLSHMLYAIIAMAGALLAIAGRLDIGSIAAFLQYARSFGHPITNVANQFNTLLAALAGAERIFDVMDQTVEEDNGKVRLIKAFADGENRMLEVGDNQVHDSEKEQAAAGKTAVWAWKIPHDDGSFELRPLKGDVRFESVTFGYVPDQDVLKAVSLFARPGQKIAFVGSTGAGKTTITNLINRFYEIQDGSITYDGIELRDINKSDLRRTLGMVLQDVHLFKGTIRDNIRYGNLDATDDDVVQAAALANAHSFIMKLPQGYDTLLDADGTNLSQGQRQLLSIARAAVADPPVLILDEATSSIDTRTEKLIEKGMDQLMHGRTTLVIAHRLSTVRRANAIMVLEHGEIIERGDHQELLNLHGRYNQLYMGLSELS